MRKIAMFLALAGAGIVGIAEAQVPKVVVSDKTGWHKIGETTVDFKKEKDEVIVMGADRFATIKFKVTGETIDLISAEVVYESGDNQLVAVNSKIKEAGDSREFNLNGGERDVKKIVLVYKTIANSTNKKARVEIWGLKTNTDTSSN
jgi:hypothetical protein